MPITTDAGRVISEAERQRLLARRIPGEFDPTAQRVTPVARPAPTVAQRMLPATTEAEAARRAAVAAAPTVGTKLHESFAGIPASVGAVFTDVARPITETVYPFAREVVTGTPAAEVKSAPPNVPVAAPAPKPAPQAAPPTADRPKLGLPRDFAGQLGSFDISQEGGVQVIRGPAIARPGQTGGGAGVISPLDMANYNLDVANSMREAASSANKDRLDIAKFIQENEQLRDVAGPALRLAMTSSDPLTAASILAELAPRLALVPEDQRASALAEAFAARLAEAQ